MEKQEHTEMVTKKSWEEFRDSGLLWMINSTLHIFGWSIVIEIDGDGVIHSAYPARVKFRGFDNNSNTRGYIKVSEYLKENIDSLEKEAKE